MTGVVLRQVRDPYDTSSCKGVAIAEDILGGPARAGASSAEAAVHSFAAHGGSAMGPTFPTEGWQSHGGTWVSDVDGGFYRVTVSETPSGWYVTGVWLCSP